MLYLRTFFIVVWIINTISAQTANPGPCPDVKAIDNFEVDKFLGFWYELSRSLPNSYEPNTECVTFHYSLDDYGFIRIIQRQFSEITRLESQMIGNATIDKEACGNETNCGKLIVGYLKPDGSTLIGPLWVLDVQYSSYAVLYSCRDYPDTMSHAQRIYIIGRHANVADSVVKGIQDGLISQNLSGVQFERTKHYTLCGGYYRDYQIHYA